MGEGEEWVRKATKKERVFGTKSPNTVKLLGWGKSLTICLSLSSYGSRMALQTSIKDFQKTILFWLSRSNLLCHLSYRRELMVISSERWLGPKLCIQFVYWLLWHRLPRHRRHRRRRHRYRRLFLSRLSWITFTSTLFGASRYTWDCRHWWYTKHARPIPINASLMR